MQTLPVQSVAPKLEQACLLESSSCVHPSRHAACFMMNQAQRFWMLNVSDAVLLCVARSCLCQDELRASRVSLAFTGSDAALFCGAAVAALFQELQESVAI